MSDRAVITRKARQAIESVIEGSSQKQAADFLGVRSAHLWKLRNEDYLSPMLKRAMIEAGWLTINKRSPRISIQRDDAAAAATSIINLAGSEQAVALADEIHRVASKVRDGI